MEAQHGWALSTAPARSKRSGEPKWSLRNGGCGDGLPCEAENEGRGKTESNSSVGMNRMETEAVVQSGIRELLDWNDREEVEAARAALFDRMKANDQRCAGA